MTPVHLVCAIELVALIAALVLERRAEANLRRCRETAAGLEATLSVVRNQLTEAQVKMEEVAAQARKSTPARSQTKTSIHAPNARQARSYALSLPRGHDIPVAMLRERFGLSSAQATNLMTTLAASGFVTHTRYGIWTRTAKGVK